MISLRFLSPAAALAALTQGLAMPLTAQNITHDPDPALVEIQVAVQEIAVLSVVDGSASTVMDDPDPAAVGDPSSFVPTSDMAQLELATNFCVGLEIDFPTVLGIRPHPISYYGQAIGIGNSNTLGVQPFYRVENSAGNFGNTTNLSGSSVDAPMSLSAATGNLCDGYYDIYLGAVTQWDLTLPGEPLYAEPDTYRIPVTVSLVP